MRLIAPILLIAVLLASCASPNPQQQAEIDAISAEQVDVSNQYNAALDYLMEISPRVGVLLERSVNGTITAEEAIELQSLIATGPADIERNYNAIVKGVGDWWDLEEKKNAVLKEAGGGWLDNIGYAGVGVATWLLGLGTPTSGPLAPALTFLQPVLEKIGLRRPEVRAVARAKFTKPSATMAGFDPSVVPPSPTAGSPPQ